MRADVVSVNVTLDQTSMDQLILLKPILMLQCDPNVAVHTAMVLYMPLKATTESE